MSKGWMHYAIHPPELHVLLFKWVWGSIQPSKKKAILLFLSWYMEEKAHWWFWMLNLNLKNERTYIFTLQMWNSLCFRRLKDFQTLAVHVQESFMKHAEELVSLYNNEHHQKGKENRTALAQMYPWNVVSRGPEGQSTLCYATGCLSALVYIGKLVFENLGSYTIWVIIFQSWLT